MANLKKRNGNLLRTGPAGSGDLVRACVTPGPPCSYCGPTGPITGGTITFSGIPTSFTSSYFDGVSTHIFTITGFNLNHSRVLDLVVIGNKCCWYGAETTLTTVDYKYERTGASPHLCHQTIPLKMGVTDSHFGAPIDPCNDPTTFASNPRYQISGTGPNTVLAGTCADAGGGQRFDWGSACGSESALDFMSLLPFPNRVYRQVVTNGQISPGIGDTGSHYLSVCAWTKTLNCGFGTVTWTPF